MHAAGTGEGVSRLTLGNQHHALSELAAWLAELAGQHDLPPRVAFRLELVLTEAVTNIMDHAADTERAGRIDIACQIDADAVRIVLSDDGDAFDPTTRAAVVLPASLDTARPGGLGIHLMRRYTRSLAYRRENGRNVLSLTLPRIDDTPAP
jgi:sigma-B regulation protein RsbU (phosphoserine phosphatase)